jgi:hypothetical protein
MASSTSEGNSASSVAVVQDSHPEEARQRSSRPLTVRGNPSSASEGLPLMDLSGLAQGALAAAVQRPISPLLRTHQRSGTEANFISAPSPLPQVQRSGDHSTDPRNPQTLEMLEDENRNHIRPMDSAEQNPSMQIVRRSLDDRGTRITAPLRAHDPDWPGAACPVPAGEDPKMPPVASSDRWQALRADSPSHYGAARPSSSVSTQPSPRPLFRDSNSTRLHHEPTRENPSSPSQAHAPVPIPSPSALLSGVGPKRGSDSDPVPGTSLPNFNSLVARQDHQAPLQELPLVGRPAATNPR